MLKLKQINKEYKTGELVQHALNNVSLNLRDNEFVAILGPSGSGKTTLLNIIGGLDRYDSGDLIINGISTKKYTDRDWDSYRNHTIGFVFQSYNLIPHQTVLGNVELALTISGVSKAERRRRAAAALEQQLPGCIAIQCDVASRASCELAFHAVEQAMGRVDVLVCNAGIAQQKLFTDITPEEWQRMLDVNLSGAFHLCQLALPGMIRRKAGRILTVSSMWGQTGGSCEVHYSAAKAGLIGLTKALAKEEGPSGITVNCVAPGVIDTDMMAAFTAEDKAALAEETPVGRLGSADEVAQLLVFLAGESAGYITGQVFGVNGGLVI